MADLSVVVLTYNNNILLKDCLDSILSQRFLPGNNEIIVVDNGSDEPASYSYADSAIRFVRLKKNVGNINGTNECVATAGGRWVLFVANDVRLYKDCLINLWKAAQTAERPGLIQPTLIQPNGEVDNAGLNWVWPGYGIRNRHPNYWEEYSQVEVVANTCWMVSRADFPGLDASLGISHEDVDVCLRMGRMGYKHYAVSTAVATHLMGQTIGKSIGKPLSPYYHKARLRVIEKNYQGMDRMARLAAVKGLDGLNGCRLGR